MWLGYHLFNLHQHVIDHAPQPRNLVGDRVRVDEAMQWLRGASAVDVLVLATGSLDLTHRRSVASHNLTRPLTEVQPTPLNLHGIGNQLHHAYEVQHGFINHDTTVGLPLERASCLAPLDIHDEWQVSERRYLSETSMALLDPTSDTSAVTAIQTGD